METGTPIRRLLTPLLAAVEVGRLDVVRLLLDAGADPNDDERRDNSLAVALEKEHAEIADLLRARGATEPEGTPLTIAAPPGGIFLDLQKSLTEMNEKRRAARDEAKKKE